MNVTSLRMRVLPRFPARITGTDGIKVERESNGAPDLIVRSAFDQLVDINTVPDTLTNYFMMWDSETGEYRRIPFQDMFDSAGVALGYPTISTAENANIPPVVHAIEVYGDNTVGDGAGGLFIDTNNGSGTTFISGDGRTWYLAADVHEGRLTAALLAQIGAAYVSVAAAQAATITARNRRIRVQFYAPNYAQPKTLVGGAHWRRISFADLTGYPALAYFRSADRFMPDGTVDNTNGGYWVIDESIIYGEMLSAVLDGVVDCTAAINAAIAVQGLRGGGEVRIGLGTALLSNSNPGAGSWDNRRSIYINYDNIHFRMAKGTILKLANGANSHVIKLGSRVEGVLTVHNVTIEGGAIDGNRLNQLTPTVTDEHNNGIDVATGCTKITIRDMHIHDCMYYGVGFENGGYVDCTVDNLTIEDVGADGIDMKDNDFLSSGNTCRNVRVRRFGLVGVLVQQAGINPRTGWNIQAVQVTEYTGDRHGIRIDAANVANSGIPTKLNGFFCEPSTVDTTEGVRMNISTGSDDADVIVQNGVVRGGLYGIRNRTRYGKISDIVARGCDTGFYLYADTQGTNLTARKCGTGCYLEDGNNRLTNYSAYQCTVVGLNVGGGTLNRISEGVFSGNTTNVIDAGTQTAIGHIGGINTHSVGTANFAIDSTGTKNVAIAHGLSFTPAINDVVLTFQRNTNVGDFTLGFFWVYQTDATNVYCNVRVTAASATAGALLTMVANCEAKRALRQ